MILYLSHQHKTLDAGKKSTKRLVFVEQIAPESDNRVYVTENEGFRVIKHNIWCF